MCVCVWHHILADIGSTQPHMPILQAANHSGHQQQPSAAQKNITKLTHHAHSSKTTDLANY
jgi:hypothetical protein